MPVINSIAAMADDMTEWRRDIHAHPETCFEEVRTSALVAEKLESWGIEVHRNWAKTGVVGVLEGRAGGRSIGLRADMDALPMTEQTGAAYASRTEGKFHGCGHDGHTTMLLGAARYLAESRNFSGRAVFIFQPAEEGGGGGKVMVEEGLFDRFDCNEVYALHNWPGLALGQAGISAGPVMAATDTFDIVITGKGGHAALPHHTVDPIVIGSHLVTALQGVASRSIDPIDPVVVSVTQFHAGSAYNVIPGEAMLCGTVRTFSEQARRRAEQRISDICAGIAAAFEGDIDCTYIIGYPPTVNPAEHCDIARDIVGGVLGPGSVVELPPTMGGEDFSYLLEQRPGAYIQLGADEAGREGAALHHPEYDFNDNLLPVGASVLASIVEERLR